MKTAKYIPAVALTAVLAGCSDHGYEGEYQAKTGSSNEMFNNMAKSLGSQKIIIGADYIESDGSRKSFDDIFIRESGAEKFLVFKDEQTEEAWKIVDQNTLIKGSELMNVTLVRTE